MEAKCFIGTGRNTFCNKMLVPFWIKQGEEIVFPPEFKWTEKTRNRNEFNKTPATNREIGLAYPIRASLFGTKYTELDYIRQDGLNYTGLVYNGLFMANKTLGGSVYIPFWFIDGCLKDQAIAERIAVGVQTFLTECPTTQMQMFIGVGENHPSAIETFRKLGIDYMGQWNFRTKQFIR